MKKTISLFAFLFIVVSLLFSCPVFAAESDTANQIAFTTVYPDGFTPDPEQKIVYLTFDDGPTEHTPAILEILAKYNVPATFFVVGETTHTHLMRDIVDNSHAIGLHCYNHNFEEIYRSTESFFADLAKIDDIVFEHTGVRSKIMRFPGGSSVTRGTTKAKMNTLKEEVKARGYQFFDWNCDSSDKRGASTAAEAFNKIKNAEIEGNIAIVLMHDTQKITVQYLPQVIEYFKALGFEFAALCIDSPAIHHSW